MRSEVSETSPRISINTARPGRSSEAKAEAGTGERMVSIKCQRLRPDKTYEEVDIEVPEAVYNTMSMSNNKPGGGQPGDRGQDSGAVPPDQVSGFIKYNANAFLALLSLSLHHRPASSLATLVTVASYYCRHQFTITADWSDYTHYHYHNLFCDRAWRQGWAGDTSLHLSSAIHYQESGDWTL